MPGPRRLCAILLLLSLFSVPASAQPLVAEGEAQTAQEQLRSFQVPPGYEIQLVAAEPEIRKPINLSFDAAGRLYATESVEYPYAAPADVPHRDSVKVFWDFAADGHAQQSAVAVDNLNIPIGVSPLADGLLVYSIRDGVLLCHDRDGDGHYEERRSLFSGFGFDDTHGMVNAITPWIDGWVYACHGFRNDSRTVAADGSAVEMNSGNTFRFRPDGSRVEQWTHGQVNPFGLAFDPLGNLYSSDCHTLPAYQLLRGAWYPSFGKPHDGLGYGPEMIRHNHGSTGIAGIVYYAADHFPADRHDTLFIGNPVTGRINHDRLDPHGSTLLAVEQPDFVSSSDGWFRPVDLQLGPDGALYIADFYNRIIGHYEVPLDHPGRDRERGRIWRVVFTGEGAKPPVAPNLATATCEELIGYLDSPTLPVRVQAVHQLVGRIGQEAVEPLKQKLAADATPNLRVYGNWVLQSLRALTEFDLASDLAASDGLSRVHAIKLANESSLWSDGVSQVVRQQLSVEDPFVRRAAADALARHPSPDNIAPLVTLWSATPADDTHLVHTARMALRDQLLAPGAYEQARSLAAADADSFRRLAEISLGVANADGARFALDYQLAHPEDGALRLERLRHIARHLDADALGDLYVAADAYRSASAADQLQVLRSIAQGLQERGAALADAQRAWSSQQVQLALAAQDEGLVRLAIDTARELHLIDCYDALAAAAGPQAPFGNQRTAAIDACLATDGGKSIDLLAAIVGGGEEPLDIRQHAAAALGGMADTRAVEFLATHLVAAPEALSVSIASGLAATPEGAESLLRLIAEGKTSPRLLQDRVVRARLGGHNLRDLDARLEALTANLPPADERLAALREERRNRYLQTQADPALGVAAFKKVCANCHRLRGEGNKVGPELDGVGLRGLDRLLEDMLDPSRNVDQAFRSTQVVTTGGQVILGLKLRDEGQVLILADAQGKEIRIPAADIDEQALTALSPMPANVAEVVPEGDFYHLLAFLLSQREKPAPAP